MGAALFDRNNPYATIVVSDDRMTYILAFLFVLGVLVFVHELGHFLVARWYGVRVHTFSLGFGPKILKITRGGTEYCISIVPLGGYVKLAGETVEDQRSGAPDEFLSKSKWVRFQVYLAGPIMNLLLAFVVLAISMMGGAEVALYDSAPPIVGTVASGSPAEQVGIHVGDRVLTVNGRAVETWDALSMAVVPKANMQLTIAVERAGERLEFKVTPDAVGRFEIGDLGLLPVIRPQVSSVYPGRPAERAGFKKGDVLIALNGQRGLRQSELIKQIQQSAGKSIVFTVEREDASVDLAVVPEGSAGAATIGVQISPFETRHVDPTVGQAFKLSAQENWKSTLQIGETLKGLFTRETQVKQLMGPLGIAELSGSAAELGFGALLALMAMISLNLGLLNLMPVPVLDGGHIAILAVEGLARRDLSSRVKERILIAGAALIALLMVTVIYNDIARLMR
jgi:regulator of sigma E protease